MRVFFYGVTAPHRHHELSEALTKLQESGIIELVGRNMPYYEDNFYRRTEAYISNVVRTLTVFFNRTSDFGASAQATTTELQMCELEESER